MQSCINIIDPSIGLKGESVRHRRLRLIAIPVIIATGLSILSAKYGIPASANSHASDSAAVAQAVSDFHAALETGDSTRAL